ncbi:MAG: ornithine cyclodeaminase family protein [Vicinamibacterales bacterium]
MIEVFREEEIRAAVPPAAAVEAVRRAFRADGEGRTIVPAVINLPIREVDGEFHIKTAYIEGMSYVAVKIASGFYRNPARGLPSGTGLMALFDASTGFPAAFLLDNGYLTDIRTGAAGAVAAEALARREVDCVGVIGSGTQARHQVRCLRQVRGFERVRAWSNDPQGLQRYVGELGSELGVEAIAAGGPAEVCAEADILITATPAREAIVRVEYLRPGMHVTALGSDGPGKQELDPRCLCAADMVVTDRREQCARLGELQHAIAAGLMREDDVHANLGEVVAGSKPGRTSDSQITIADLTGVGFQDTAIASLAFERLRRTR